MPEPGSNPILQLALDFLDLPRALALAHEAVEGGMEWLEAGTPLIKSEGMESLRTLRAAFPALPLVADLKIMDAGRMEMEAAAKAGATVATVLGVAGNETIRECVEVGANYGIKIAVDLIGCPDPVGRAREVEALGADLLSFHTGIDEQMQGKPSFKLLEAVCRAVSLPVAAAGGLHSETAVLAARAGASIVIVGGAITKAADARKATVAIKKSLTSGRPVRSAQYRRVDHKNIHTALIKASTANLSDALHRQKPLEGVTPLFSPIKIAGPALTVRTCPGDWSKPVQAIDTASKGDVLVIDSGGVGPAVWGELASLSALNKGLAGVVIYGACRDSAEIRALGLALFSLLRVPNAGEPKGFGEVGIPLDIGGQHIYPGDWIVGDDDGVMVLPQKKAVEYANRALDVYEREQRLRAEIEKGSTLGEVGYLKRWDKR